MNLMEFCKEVNININYTNVRDLRTIIYNTHILNLSPVLKQERINILIKIDELLDTNIENRKY